MKSNYAIGVQMLRLLQLAAIVQFWRFKKK